MLFILFAKSGWSPLNSLLLNFKQSLALQSMSFHVARMLGPTVAGIIMALKGPSFVFLFDALSYIGVIIIIYNIHLREKVLLDPQNKHRGFEAIMDGLKYFFSDAAKRYKQFQLLLTIFIIVPLISMVFRTFLKEKFHLNAAEFGYLFSFPAVGAMSGAFYFTFFPLKVPIRNLLYSVPSVVIILLLIRVVPTSHAAAILLGFCGFFSYINVASITQSLHLDTIDDFRGRLGSLLTL